MNPKSRPLAQTSKKDRRLVLAKIFGLAPSIVATIYALVLFIALIASASGTSADIAIPFIFLMVCGVIFVLALDAVIQVLCWAKPARFATYILLTRSALLSWLAKDSLLSGDFVLSNHEGGTSIVTAGLITGGIILAISSIVMWPYVTKAWRYVILPVVALVMALNIYVTQLYVSQGNTPVNLSRHIADKKHDEIVEQDISWLQSSIETYMSNHNSVSLPTLDQAVNEDRESYKNEPNFLSRVNRYKLMKGSAAEPSSEMYYRICATYKTEVSGDFDAVSTNGSYTAHPKGYHCTTFASPHVSTHYQTF